MAEMFALNLGNEALFLNSDSGVNRQTNLKVLSANGFLFHNVLYHVSLNLKHADSVR